MHLSDGILSIPVLTIGNIVGIAGTAYGLKKLNTKDIPKVALLSSAFFIASLIHVPIGITSIHLILNGLIGILLSLVAFPAIFVALLLQFTIFSHGGITTIFVNTFIMASPAVLCHFLLYKTIIKEGHLASLMAFLSGFMPILFSTTLLAIFLGLSGEAFITAGKIAVIANFPLMIIEGIINTICIKYLKKIKPEVLYIYGT